MKERRYSNGFGLVLLAAFASPACVDDECDPDQSLVNHVCIAEFNGASGGSGGTPGSAGAQTGGAPSCESTFNTACFVHDECSCDATYCASYPGEEGICTRTGCVEDPAQCPEGWGCMDLSTFVAGLPAICTPPGI